MSTSRSQMTNAVATHVSLGSSHSFGHFDFVLGVPKLSPGVNLALFFSLSLLESTFSRDRFRQRLFQLLIDRGLGFEVGCFAHQEDGKDDLDLRLRCSTISGVREQQRY
jgi:hypothetical protein